MTVSRDASRLILARAEAYLRLSRRLDLAEVARSRDRSRTRTMASVARALTAAAAPTSVGAFSRSSSRHAASATGAGRHRARAAAHGLRVAPTTSRGRRTDRGAGLVVRADAFGTHTDRLRSGRRARRQANRRTKGAKAFQSTSVGRFLGALPYVSATCNQTALFAKLA